MSNKGDRNTVGGALIWAKMIKSFLLCLGLGIENEKEQDMWITSGTAVLWTKQLQSSHGKN